MNKGKDIDRFKNIIDEFFQISLSRSAAYTYVYFNFLAIREPGKDGFIVQRGRVFFNTGEGKLPDAIFSSENILAGTLRVANLGLSGEQLIVKLIEGVVQTSFGDLHFDIRECSVSKFIVDNHYNSTQAELHGSNDISRERYEELEWEVRAAEHPYDSLQDLAAEFNLGAIRVGSGGSISLVAFNVMAIDASSTINGELAVISVRAADGIDTNAASVSYREIINGNIINRHTIEKSKITWTSEENFLVGKMEVQVRVASVLHVLCSYKGMIQHQFWIADNSQSQNPKRVAYELIDPSLELMKESFYRDNFRGRDARELEATVSWLLWMLGFSVAHFGVVTRTQVPIDIIATTPQGHFAVIECTTGMLRSDSKIPKLIERTDGIRRRLELAGNRHLRVIPVIVTTKSRKEIISEVDQVERQNVCIICLENLEKAVLDTVVSQDADRIFENAEHSIKDNASKYSMESELQLNAPRRLN